MNTNYKTRPRILFIIHDVYQDDNMFPAGAGYLSAVLMQHGCEVDVYAMDVFHYTNDELAAYLDLREYDMICCGFMAARFQETITQLCEVVIAHKKDAWFILGGHGPSPVPEYILNTTKVDIVVVGEAEKTIVDLVECRTNKGTLSKVRGIAYRDGDRVHLNPRNNPVLTLDEIPFPPWDIFPMEAYASCLKFPGMKAGDRAFPILSSRGCVNRCNFCYRMERGIRLRSIKNIIDEMQMLHERYGVNYFFFLDELFVLSKKRVREFADALHERGLNVMLNVESRVDVFDDEIADILKGAGCVFVNIGFESMSQKVLDKINKNVTVEQNIRAAEIANSRGMGIGLNCLWGEPGDDEESLKANVEFIMKFNLYDQVRTIRPITPYPGCDLYDEAVALKLLKGPEDFFERFTNSDRITVNFTDIAEQRCYELLLEANTKLIMDHYEHTNKNMAEARALIEKFRQLYAGEILNFRGARSDLTLENKRNITI